MEKKQSIVCEKDEGENTQKWILLEKGLNSWALLSAEDNEYCLSKNKNSGKLQLKKYKGKLHSHWYFNNESDYLCNSRGGFVKFCKEGDHEVIASKHANGQPNQRWQINRL